jgi:RNA polymerase sigma factor (sigma-70 family)
MKQPTFKRTTDSKPLFAPTSPPKPAIQNPARHDFRERYGSAFEDGGFRRTITVLRGIGANPDLAEELAQAAWARGWERLGQLQDPGSVVEWVTSIAVRMFWDFVLKNRRISPLLTLGFEPHVAPSINLAAIDVDRALDCPRQKKLVNAVYMEGQSADELAMSLGISVGAVHHRLSRARARLRRQMTAA